MDHQDRLDAKEAAFKKTLATTHTRTTLQVGDIVLYRNEFGIVFEDQEVIGFHHEGMGEQLTNRTVYLAKEAYWFPVPADSLTTKEIK